jgi:hypothetical protein
MLGGKIRKLHQQLSVSVHRPQAACAIDSLPYVGRGRFDAAAIEIPFRDFVQAPVICPKRRNNLIPAALFPLCLLTTPHSHKCEEGHGEQYLE